MFGNQFALDLLRNNGGRRRRRAPYRPIVQVLEDRCLLSSFQEFPLPDLPRDPTDQYHRERIPQGPTAICGSPMGSLALVIPTIMWGVLPPTAAQLSFPSTTIRARNFTTS